jgi:hypothetical protein
MEGIGWEEGTDSGVIDKVSMSRKARSPGENQGFVACIRSRLNMDVSNLEHYQAKKMGKPRTSTFAAQNKSRRREDSPRYQRHGLSPPELLAPARRILFCRPLVYIIS